MKVLNKEIIGLRYHGKTILKAYLNHKLVFSLKSTGPIVDPDDPDDPTPPVVDADSVIATGVWENEQIWNNEDLWNNETVFSNN